MGAAAAGVPKGGGGGLRPVPPTPCSSVGLGGTLDLGDGLPVVLGVAPGVTPGAGADGEGPDATGDEPYGTGVAGLGEVTEDGEALGEDMPDVPMGIGGLDGVAGVGVGGDGKTTGAGGG